MTRIHYSGNVKHVKVSARVITKVDNTIDTRLCIGNFEMAIVISLVASLSTKNTGGKIGNRPNVKKIVSNASSRNHIRHGQISQ